MKRQFLPLTLALGLAISALPSCIDNEEPEGVLNLRKAKAEYIAAETALKAAEADKLTLENQLIQFQIQLKEFEVKMAELNYQMEVAESELDKMQIELAKQQVKAQMELIATQLEADKLRAKASYEAAMVAYKEAMTTLDKESGEYVNLSELYGKLTQSKNDYFSALDYLAYAQEEYTDALVGSDSLQTAVTLTYALKNAEMELELAQLEKSIMEKMFDAGNPAEELQKLAEAIAKAEKEKAAIEVKMKEYEGVQEQKILDLQKQADDVSAKMQDRLAQQTVLNEQKQVIDDERAAKVNAIYAELGNFLAVVNADFKVPFNKAIESDVEAMLGGLTGFEISGTAIIPMSYYVEYMTNSALCNKTPYSYTDYYAYLYEAVKASYDAATGEKQPLWKEVFTTLEKLSDGIIEKRDNYYKQLEEQQRLAQGEDTNAKIELDKQIYALTEEYSELYVQYTDLQAQISAISTTDPELEFQYNKLDTEEATYQNIIQIYGSALSDEMQFKEAMLDIDEDIAECEAAVEKAKQNIAAFEKGEYTNDYQLKYAKQQLEEAQKECDEAKAKFDHYTALYAEMLATIMA